MALPDVMKGGTPYMGISPGRARPRTHQPGQEQERAHQHASSCGSARDLLGTGRMSLKKCVFGCKGMITLFSFPKEPSVTWTVDVVYFFGAAMEFRKCVCWRTFYKQGPVRRWICTSFDIERWIGPSYKRSRLWFRTVDAVPILDFWGPYAKLCRGNERMDEMHLSVFHSIHLIGSMTLSPLHL